jgi:hypothetical protein
MVMAMPDGWTPERAVDLEHQATIASIQRLRLVLAVHKACGRDLGNLEDVEGWIRNAEGKLPIDLIPAEPSPGAVAAEAAKEVAAAERVAEHARKESELEAKVGTEDLRKMYKLLSKGVAALSWGADEKARVQALVKTHWGEAR